MASYTIKLLKKEIIANETMAFHWEKPDGFEFKAGQFGDFTLIDPSETDEEGNTRAFSFVYAPSENELVTATRLRDSAFKRVLKDLPVGSEVKFDAPHGNFTLHKTESTPAVFLIGGIGITPIRSMIAEATYQKTSHDMTLLFSNKTPEDAPFQSDLKELAEKNPNFNFVPVMTETDSDEWIGESGHIDAEMLKRHVSDISTPIYYLAGPAGMVQAMHKMLVEAGANEDNIRAEEFSGY
ncbi:oxidoreductase [Virgibacillus dakarensis]|uniref:Oxidoreductase n=1 Tax=Lentibacillus populi TaxID=1827502 RepID=A0A9W5TXJ2_9BACI|nr:MULTISPECIES: FAD-dependent oxidoreductase [Bacillaceae]MBT2216340.1 FAD-dependent oxidoreductase [Virgibacillus dakarensis]MTW85195.1 oxidoreductase [Virgibacillus dakarensis]GGB43592.1 oxidoreductase [Lentibacillus populi]